MPVRPRPDLNPRPIDNVPRPRRDEEDTLNPMIRARKRLEQLRKETQNYPQWDAARYQRSVANTFNRTVNDNNDYMNSLHDAASQNKPVVMLIGRSSDPATRHVIENSMKETHNKTGNDAVYVFVDMDRVDKNSAIGKYAFENMPRKGQEPPFTMVFGLSKGDASNPVRADGPSFYGMGPVDQKGVAEAVSRLKLQMNRRFDLPRPQDQQSNPFPKPDVPAPFKPGDPKATEACVMALQQAQQQKEAKDSYQFYKQAISIADSTADPRLQSATRVELGLACLNWGFGETGFKWIMEGMAKNPDTFDNQKNQGLKDRVAQSGVPQLVLEEMISKGKQDPYWWEKDKESGKKFDSIWKSTKQPQYVPAPIVRPQVQPQIQPQVDRHVDPNPHLMPSPFG